MRLHTKRGIRLGLAVGIELFLGFVLVAPFGGKFVIGKLWPRPGYCGYHVCWYRRAHSSGCPDTRRMHVGSLYQVIDAIDSLQVASMLWEAYYKDCHSSCCNVCVSYMQYGRHCSSGWEAQPAVL